MNLVIPLFPVGKERYPKNFGGFSQNFPFTSPPRPFPIRRHAQFCQLFRQKNTSVYHISPGDVKRLQSDYPAKYAKIYASAKSVEFLDFDPNPVENSNFSTLSTGFSTAPPPVVFAGKYTPFVYITFFATFIKSPIFCPLAILPIRQKAGQILPLDNHFCGQLCVR